MGASVHDDRLGTADPSREPSGLNRRCSNPTAASMTPAATWPEIVDCRRDERRVRVSTTVSVSSDSMNASLRSSG
jgi:hypothetical protein